MISIGNYDFPTRHNLKACKLDKNVTSLVDIENCEILNENLIIFQYDDMKAIYL